MKLAVFAYHDIGYECLRILLEQGEAVVAVVSHEDDPKEQIWFRSAADLARARDIPVYTPANPNEPAFVGLMRRLAPEIIFSFYYRRLLCKEILDISRLGAINLHGSLLPKYRGRAPINWVLVNGETETGVTLHHMVEEADAGDIIAQMRVPIEWEDTALDLSGKMTQAGGDLLKRTLPLIKAGTAPRIPQDPRLATVVGRRRPDDGKIRWDSPARSVYNLVRAVTHPYPGAFTHCGGRKLFIWQATVSTEWSTDTQAGKLGSGEARKPPSLPASKPSSLLAEGLPGTVRDIRKGLGLIVATGDGELIVTRVQFDGEAEMAADELVERHGIAVGTRLGE